MAANAPSLSGKRVAIPSAVDFVRAFSEAGKPVASICQIERRAQ